MQYGISVLIKDATYRYRFEPLISVARNRHINHMTNMLQFWCSWVSCHDEDLFVNMRGKLCSWWNAWRLSSGSCVYIHSWKLCWRGQWSDGTSVREKDSSLMFAVFVLEDLFVVAWSLYSTVFGWHFCKTSEVYVCLFPCCVRRCLCC